MLNSNLLKAAIVRSGYSQGEFAKQLGISPNTLTARLTGERHFTLDEIDKACEVLDLQDNNEICAIFLGRTSQK